MLQFLVVIGVIAYFITLIYNYIVMRRNSDIPIRFDIPFITRPTKEYLTRIHELDRMFVLETGPVIRFQSMIRPWKSAVLFAEPSLMKSVLAGPNWIHFNRPHTSQSAQLGHAGGLILQPNGERWRQARDVFGKRFTTTAIKSYIPCIEREIEVLIDQLKSKDGQIVDLQTYLNCFTFDTIVYMVYGIELKSLETGDTQYMQAWNDVLFSSSMMVLVEGLLGQWAWGPTGLLKKYNTAYEKIRDLAETNFDRKEFIEGAILDQVLHDSSLPEWLKNRDEMMQQLMTLLFAGFDTTSSTTSFCLSFLAEYPEWQEKLREEIQALNDFSQESLEGCHILTSIIKETLRLRPSAVYGAGRMVDTDLDIEWANSTKRGTLFKGEMILASPFITQTHPEVYERPLEFDPTRWMKDVQNGGAKNIFSMIPFGGGSRKCVGEKLAWLEMRMVIANLVSNFKWSKCKESDWTMEFIGTIRLLNGCLVRIENV